MACRKQLTSVLNDAHVAPFVKAAQEEIERKDRAALEAEGAAADE